MSKVRKEKSGVHFFNRESGLHILLDEYNISNKEITNFPRTLSMALTNRCNCNCNFCYAEKGSELLDTKFIKEIAIKLDKNETLEITFGGGEPFLHPDLTEICSWIWDNTELGISITTNGHFLTNKVMDELENKISSLRISINCVEPTYSKLREKPLNKIIQSIKYLKNKVHLGINTIFRPGQIENLKNVLDLALDLKVDDILIIPEHNKGKFLLSNEEWDDLDSIIKKYRKNIKINVTYDAYLLYTKITGNCKVVFPEVAN